MAHYAILRRSNHGLLAPPGSSARPRKRTPARHSARCPAAHLPAATFFPHKIISYDEIPKCGGFLSSLSSKTYVRLPVRLGSTRIHSQIGQARALLFFAFSAFACFGEIRPRFGAFPKFVILPKLREAVLAFAFFRCVFVLPKSRSVRNARISRLHICISPVSQTLGETGKNSNHIYLNENGPKLPRNKLFSEQTGSYSRAYYNTRPCLSACRRSLKIRMAPMPFAQDAF